MALPIGRWDDAYGGIVGFLMGTLSGPATLGAALFAFASVIHLPSASALPNIRLTNNAAVSINGRVALAPDGSVVVVWQDDRFGNDEILWQKFTQSGSPLTPVVRVTNTPARSAKPDVSSDGTGTSHIVWQEGEDANGAGSVYLCRLDGSGSRTLNEVLVNDLSRDPRVTALPDGRTDVVWHHFATLDHDVYYRRYSIAGTPTCPKQFNGGTSTTLLKTPVSCTVAAGPQDFQIYWREVSTDLVTHTRHAAGNNACQASPGERAYGDALNPSLDSRASSLSLVFEKNSDIYGFVYGGSEEAFKISTGSGTSTRPSVGANEDGGYVAWQDTRDGNSETYLAQYRTSTRTNLSGDVRLTTDPATSERPDIAVEKSACERWVVVWQDSRDGNAEIYMTSRLLIDGPTTPIPPGVPTGGLVGYWPLDNDANDESGNCNHGTVHGAAPTSPRSGAPGSAYFFDGTDDYIDVGADATLRPQLPMTIAGWVRNDSTDPAKTQLFTNDYRDNIYSGVWVNTYPIAIASIGDGGAPGPTNRRSKNGTTPLAVGTWYHVAAVVRGLTDMDLYVNGVNDGGTYGGTGGSLVYGGGPGNIGRKDANSAGPPYYHSGAIDELYFYNRALSAIEIRALYLQQRAASIQVTAEVRDPHDDSPFVNPPPALQGAKVRLVAGTYESAPMVTDQDGIAAFPINWNLAGGGHYEVQLSGPNYHVIADWHRDADKDPVTQNVDVATADPVTSYLWRQDGSALDQAPSIQAAYFVDKFRRDFLLQRLGHTWKRDQEVRVMPATIKQFRVEGGAITTGDYAGLLFSKGDLFTTVKSREADVVYHEYIHCVISDLFDQIHQPLIPPRVLGIANDDEGNAMDEAFADYFAAAFTEDPVIDRHAKFVHDFPQLPGWMPQRDISEQPIRRYRSPWREQRYPGSLILSGTLWSIRTGSAEPLQFDSLVFRGLKRMIETHDPRASVLFLDYRNALLAEAQGSGFEMAIEQAFSAQNIRPTPLPLPALAWVNDDGISNVITTPNQVQVSWTPLLGAVSYQVQVGTTWYDPELSIGDLVTVATGLTGTTYVFDEREPRTEYLFSVVAIDSAGYAGYRANPVFVEASDSTVVAVDESSQPVAPRGRWLFNTPNPFNPETHLHFQTVEPNDPVEVTVFSVTGRLIWRLAVKTFTPGRYSVSWDGRDSAGRKVASGKYFVRLSGCDWADTGRVVLLN